MKLPWDRNYLKIALHAVVAIVAAYILIMLVDSAAFVLTNMKNIMDSVSGFINGIFSVFAVVVIAFVLAYLLDPAVDFFQKHYTRFMDERLRPRLQKLLLKVPLYRKLRREPALAPVPAGPVYARRTAGTLLTYLVIALIIAVIVMLLVAYFGGGKAAAGGNVTDGVIEGIISGANTAYLSITELYAELRVMLEEWGVAEGFSNMLSDLMIMLRDFIRAIPNHITSIAGAAGSIIATSLIAIVVAFYFMRDKAHILAQTKVVAVTLLPDKLERRISGWIREINEVFAGYIRGQLTDAMIMSVLFSIGLSVVGVPFAVPIGIFSGLSNIIPYFGAIVAFCISMLASLLSGDPTRALWAALVILALQQIDGMFIVPRVVGQKVELSPALVMISLAVGGNLFGVPGMVFAVPVCALGKAFFSRYIKRVARARELERNGAGA